MGSQRVGHDWETDLIWSLLLNPGPLLASLKPIKRPGWWKGKFALFWMLATLGEGRVEACPKASSPISQSVGKKFYRWREGATCRNSTVSSDSHLEVGHPWSDQHHLGCLGSVCFHFLRPVVQIVELMSWLQSGHPVINSFHLVGVLVSIRQLTGYGSECYL